MTSSPLSQAHAPQHIATPFLTTVMQIEPHWIEIVERSLPIVGLPPRLVGKRLVQVSDLHAGPVVDQRWLCESMERVADLRPDLLVATGIS